MKSAARKQLPAFGRELLRLRSLGVRPDPPGVIVSSSFDFARSYPGWRVVVPDNIDPLSLDFSFVIGLEVLVIAETEERLDVIAHAIAACRPVRLIGTCAKPPRIVPYIRL